MGKNPETMDISISGKKISQDWLRRVLFYRKYMILKFVKYINSLIWKRIDRDKVYWAQCVDFVKQYASDWWLPITTYGNAIDLWTKWLWPNWKKVMNAWSNYPGEWSIVIFSWPTKYGHIAIVDINCSVENLRVIEQNAWSWNGDWKWQNAIRRHTYDYINPKCLGWFTPNK